MIRRYINYGFILTNIIERDCFLFKFLTRIKKRIIFNYVLGLRL